MEGYKTVKRFDVDTEKGPEGGRKRFLYIAACTVNLTAFACGIALGWTSPITPKLKGTSGNPLGEPITTEQSSWIASLLPLGAAIGPWFAGISADKVGRKLTLFSTTLPITFAFVISAFATNIWFFYLARFMCGLSIGGIFTVLPIYIGEISTDEDRGPLGSFMQLFITLGLLFAYCVGPYVEISTFNLYSTVIPLMFLFALYLIIPETPHYYIAKGSMCKANESLKKLRMMEDVSVELNGIQNSVENSLKDEGSFKELFQKPNLRKALILSVGLVAFQQLSGINIVLFCAQSIFDEAAGAIEPEIAAIIISAVQVGSSLMTPFFVEKSGKRFLLIMSGLLMGLSQALLGTYFYYHKGSWNLDNYTYLPVGCLITYIIFYCLGFGPLPWAIMGELFPSNVKSISSTFTASGCWILGWMLLKFFDPVMEVIGIGPSFWLFSGFCFLSIIFVYKYLPETSGKSLQEIQDILCAK